MSHGIDWQVLLLAAVTVLIVVLFFRFMICATWDRGFRLVEIIQNWPSIRRARAEADAKAGRIPAWKQTARIVLPTLLILLLAYFAWRRFG